jgi:acyl-CoA synthetase (AMP-forming)/AMP-acid ligase II
MFVCSIVKVQEDCKDTPLRDKHGRCIKADYDEPGLVIAMMNDVSPTNRFDGYSDGTSSTKKILHDVFRPGDKYFNSGDLLQRDAFGFFYWSDRVGDTFRWKGENVATTEVEHVISGVRGVADVAVYGVEVPHCDGKCGMAALTLSPGVSVSTLDWLAMHQALQSHLPVYARPLFFRIQDSLQVTSTFKHQKNDLVKDGFDPAVVLDKSATIPQYYSSKEGTFVDITATLYQRIMDGELKL